MLKRAISCTLLLLPLAFSAGNASARCGGGNITVNCQTNVLTIDGKEFPNGTECGAQTGRSAREQHVRMSGMGKASGKRLHSGKRGLRMGTPLILTNPLPCDNCVIHVGKIHPGTVSLGCIHVTAAEFDLLKQCMGHGSMQIIPRGGAVKRSSQKPVVNDHDADDEPQGVRK